MYFSWWDRLIRMSMLMNLRSSLFGNQMEPHTASLSRSQRDRLGIPSNRFDQGYTRNVEFQMYMNVRRSL